MAFGLTPEGLVIKRQADILSEIRQSLRTALGANLNLLPSTVEGQIVGIVSEREALLWELLEAVYNSQYPDTAEGTSLDNVAAITGVKRLAATFSKAILILGGLTGTPIPAGSVVSVDGTPTSKFNTDLAVVIQPSVNEIQQLSFTATPTVGDFKIQIGALTTALISFAANAAAVQAAINLLAGYVDVTVTGSFAAGFTINFIGGAGGQDQPTILIPVNTLFAGIVAVNVGVTIIQEGAPSQATVTATAQNTGPIVAPAGSLTVIESPVGGWNTVTNPEDATVGTNIETDTELRLRRIQLLGAIGTATLQALVTTVREVVGVTQTVGFENLLDVVDGFGRPGHSFEIVALGGLDQDIFDAIFRVKPAGIFPFGSVSGFVVDSQGFSHAISFSRPTSVPIWIVVNVTSTPDFPTNGASLIVQALLAAGQNLQIGQTVVVFGSNGLGCSIDQIPGILSYDFFIGLAPGPVTSTPIVLGPKDLAELDSSRIAVTVV